MVLPAERVLLAVSVYVPPMRGPAGRELLADHLRLIRQAILGLRAEVGNKLDILVVGDFNRHDQLWGGDLVATSKRQGEANLILQFMAEFGLQSLLPRGTITFVGTQGRSTIDLTLASVNLTHNLLRCQTHSVEHGSDHRAIVSTFRAYVPNPEPQQPRYSFREVNWDEVTAQIRHLRGRSPTITCPEELDRQLQYLVGEVERVLHRITPKPKPSPYCKRWWTQELTEVRDEYNRARNQCERARRYGYPRKELEDIAKELRQRYHTKIREQKKKHWKEFVENAENIWKAARYLDTSERGGTVVPALRTSEKTVEQDAEKAGLLLSSFFPRLPEIQLEEGSEGEQPRIPMSDRLSLEEVRNAVMRAKPWKAPGQDGLPIGVWQKVWPVVGERVVHIFEASIQLSYVPAVWKIAKIITLPKAYKDPSLPNSYRPISLLSTLGKALEAVVAGRISNMVDQFGLLPANHFGARRRRSCEQALNVLVEKIHTAWQKQMVLSLVSFDVKGAYNGVAREVLLRRLRERRIPEILVRWIDAFCRERRATIVVNSYCSTVREIADAGLPQGSPLSPILFLFMNANLVEVPITDRGGAVAFVDDYSAWVVGPSAEANTRRLQEEVVHPALRWARTSGALFEAKKTQFVHFTRCPRKRMLPALPLWVDGAAVNPREVVKLLGVILDQGLTFKSHVGEIAKRGMRAVLALRRLRAIPPVVARQLFTATVAPKIDYAASVWCCPSRHRVVAKWIEKPLSMIQRIASQAIVGCLKTVTLHIAEAEAGIEPVVTRLRKRVLKHWVKCHTLPRSHPFWICRHAVADQQGSYPSPFKLLGKLCPEPSLSMEIIEPAEVNAQILGKEGLSIDLEPLCDLESRRQDSKARIWLFTQSIERRSRVGYRLTVCVYNRTFVARSQLAGDSASIRTQLASLMAIQDAINYLEETLSGVQMEPSKILAVICTNDLAALQSLHHPARLQSGQGLRLEIRRVASRLIDKGFQIQLRWTPSGPAIQQVTQAKELAIQATETGVMPSTPMQAAPETWRLVRGKLDRQAREEFITERWGRWTRLLDAALPGKHTKFLYDNLPRPQAAVLAQLRTGHIPLNNYLQRVRHLDGNSCGCGEDDDEGETVQHFLFRCPKWELLRQEMKEVMGSRYGDLSYALGGRSWDVLPNGQPVDKIESWKPNLKAVRAVLRYVMSTGRLDGETGE